MPLRRNRRQQCRLDFCRPRATWSVTDWRRVIFSDESRFSLSADGGAPERSDPVKHTAISQGVTVWGEILGHTRSSLVVLHCTLTARRYVDDILTPIVLPISSRPGAIYQQDNARPHTARFSQHEVMTSYHGLFRSFANRACLDALGKSTAAVPRSGELTAQMQRLWQDLPQGVKVI
ncbi:HTH_Tnp_Tc3_2 domain-containing protein [Trichonephila clavipes]|nr:HTH_Tnp_Tc3_2 domain-containing protein [Trichonephila clavipes]